MIPTCFLTRMSHHGVQQPVGAGIQPAVYLHRYNWPIIASVLSTFKFS